MNTMRSEMITPSAVEDPDGGYWKWIFTRNFETLRISRRRQRLRRL